MLNYITNVQKIDPYFSSWKLFRKMFQIERQIDIVINMQKIFCDTYKYIIYQPDIY